MRQSILERLQAGRLPSFCARHIRENLTQDALFIVPVHSQYRGRRFFPVADPKSAEVLSKALLLARDEEIREPAILQQIGRES